MKVKELSPGMRKIDIIVKVIKKGEPRQVFVRRDGRQHDVVDLVVGDDTGIVSMSLWDEMIQQIKENDIIQITNGYAGEFGGKIQLNIGQFGQWSRLDSSEHDMDVYLEEVELPSTYGTGEFMKVVDVLRRTRGINLLVRVIDQKETRTVTTRKDGKSHDIYKFVLADETGCIDFDLWDKGDDIAVGDVIEIHGGYTREFNNILTLNLSRVGTYEKSLEEIAEVNKTRDLSKPSF